MQPLHLIVAIAAISLPSAIGQDQLHQNISGVSLTAASMQRDMSPATFTPTIQLKGNVEIRKPLCARVGRKRSLVCEAEMVLHADEAEYRADTGEIIPNGNVRVSFEKLK
jgi:hypothetical protein